mgnify:CR=1 FL=1
MTLDHLKEDIEQVRADVQKIADRQMNYVEEHHELEKEVVAIKSDVSYIRKGQEAMTSNMTRLMFIVVGSFASAFVLFIVRGGLAL